MNNLLQLNDQQRRLFFEQTAVRVHLPVSAIEKDFWVTEMLRLLFSLPYADKMVFKGGTSLSKIWGVIRRFSEDIDIAVDRELFGIDGDISKKQLKRLRKASSIFVRDVLAQDLNDAVDKAGLSDFITIIPEPDGEGDATYPEPRKIHIVYKSVFPDEKSLYLRDEVQLEVGARSLLEPTAKASVRSFVEESFSQLKPSEHTENILVAIAEKTFLEKVFLLHELFTTEGCRNANRKSRHLYDLYKMMESGIVDKAITNDDLWETIRHHREVFTSIRSVDYTPDVRKRICLTPPADVKEIWEEDYNSMAINMIYEDSIPSFTSIITAMNDLESKFRSL